MMKKALVTGASEGLGRGLAIRLAAEGYAITAVARNEDRLKTLMQELGSPVNTYYVADLSTHEGIRLISEELRQTHHNLLLNNAGMGVYGRFDEQPLEVFQEMTRLNCDAIVALAHTFLQTAQHGDALINISSLLSYLPMPALGVYAATKTFVSSFSESLWFEQKDRGVYVMGVCPGALSTNFLRRRRGSEPPRHHASGTISQHADEVVDHVLKALRKRKHPIIFTGPEISLVAFCARFAPRRLLVNIMGNRHQLKRHGVL